MSEKGHTVQVQLRTHKPRSSVRLIDNNELEFAFPAIGKDCILRMNFQRTLRVPDDEVNNLPPGLDRFELEHVEDYEGRIPQKWLEHGGLMLPMYQAEAMWISFRSPREYPFAVRIAAGKICAVTGDEWKPGLVKGTRVDGGKEQNLQNYLPVPDQPWIDGFCVEKGVIRQFVAAPLGEGQTAEEQLTGKAEFGGIQIQVYPLKKEKKQAEERSFSSYQEDFVLCSRSTLRPSEMGLGAVGRIHQEIYKDRREVSDYDTTRSARAYVHLVNSADWSRITGLPMPRKPISAEDYIKAGLPWFDYYSEESAVSGSNRLAGLKPIEVTDGNW